MMHGHEKSVPAAVAMKPTNKAERSPAERSAAVPTAAESAEPRGGDQGKCVPANHALGTEPDQHAMGFRRPDITSGKTVHTAQQSLEPMKAAWLSAFGPYLSSGASDQTKLQPVAAAVGVAQMQRLSEAVVAGLI